MMWCMVLPLAALLATPGLGQRRQEDSVWFPTSSPVHSSKDEVTSPEEPSTSSEEEFPFANQSLHQIPLSEIQRLNEIEDLSEFFRLFAVSESDEVDGEVKPLLENRFGDDDKEKRNNVETPKPAKCEPELTTVPLHDSDNPFHIFFPSCTRVKRCGGCCNSDLLSCQPTAEGVQLRNFQVYVSEYSNGRMLPFRKKQVVTVDEHTKCTCDCRIKAKDCNDFQEYRPKDCRCRCVNHEDRQKCESDNSTKIWNYDTCMCRCREVSECSTGFFFDEQTCSCRSEPVLLTRFGSDGSVKRRRPAGNRYSYSTSPQRSSRRNGERGDDTITVKNLN